jgi:hypothetical protein
MGLIHHFHLLPMQAKLEEEQHIYSYDRLAVVKALKEKSERPGSKKKDKAQKPPAKKSKKK